MVDMDRLRRHHATREPNNGEEAPEEEGVHAIAADPEPQRVFAKEEAVTDETNPQSPSLRRTRASQPAITATLRAIQDTGLVVERVCISGGQVEIYCGNIEGSASKTKDEGLEEW